MEDVLDLYGRPYDPKRPVVCLDEFSIELRDEKILPLPAEPGKIKRQDYEYIRKGCCSVFLIVEPLAGKRQVIISGKRGKREFAEVLRRLIEEWYPADKVEKIGLVMDNLNTHKASSLYDYLQAPRVFSDN